MAKSSSVPVILAGITIDSGEFWREVAGGGLATAAVLLLVLFLQLVRAFTRRRAVTSDQANLVAGPAPASLAIGSSTRRYAVVVSSS